MDGSHCCMDCGAALQADDGHDLCPICLGRDHLVEALSENLCMNCTGDEGVVRLWSLQPPSRRKRAKSDQGLAMRVEIKWAPTPLSVPPSEEYLRECRVTDIQCKAYNAGAPVGRLGNSSLAHLMFALSTSLQDTGGATAAVGFCNTALQALVIMARELGHVMSFLIQACGQVWMVQSPPLCRWTLRGVPVVPVELFGAAALEALEQTVQVRQTSQQLSGLRRSAPIQPLPFPVGVYSVHASR
ncbi:hypothetical protein GOODEAATRI_023758 [Goodea atripinnis]|uniref:Uncharacterized protein n=1 Tax=Goodea atripinnis TaxID=208336 RepID=A0ABV0NX50_9TELE